MRKLLYIIRLPFFIPHFLFFRIFENNILKEELEQWVQVIRINKGSTFRNFMYFIINFREYRSLFYHRVGHTKTFFISWYAPGMSNLYFRVKRESIGVGLVMQHSNCTRFGPATCGKNCQVWHNVTVGRAKPSGGVPSLGDNVKVCAGAMAFGNISIGNNVTLAAGAVVVKNVPDNCLVVGNPARIVRKDGVKVDILL